MCLNGCALQSREGNVFKFETKDEFLDYLMGGYLEGSDSIYLVSRGRLKTLYTALGLTDCNSIFTVNKEELLLFRRDVAKLEPNELGTLVLSADAPPKFIRSPEELWDGQCRVFYHSETHGMQCLDKERFNRWSNPPIHKRLYKGDSIKLSNGYTINGNASVYMDEDARFMCFRKLDKQLEYGAYTYYDSEPIYLISVDNPQMKLESRLKWFPESMVIHDNQLFLGTITLKKELSLFHFEVFDIIGRNELQYVKDYYVDVPWVSALHTAYMLSYDHQSHSQELQVYRNFPFRSDNYIYYHNGNRLERIGDTSYVFIDPAILKNAVQYVDLESLR
jgi:hypothetical protein